jgi:microcystin-dependent protein
MSEPFLAEVKMFGFNFPPRGFAQCDGQILPINQNQSLYSLLGTMYGGDGRTTFGLPDLRGRTPMHKDTDHPLAQKTGEENHTVTLNEMPAHNHQVMATQNPADRQTGGGAVFANADINAYRAPGSGMENMSTEVLLNTGGGAAHNNMQPYQVINFVIAISGLFPSRN